MHMFIRVFAVMLAVTGLGQMANAQMWGSGMYGAAGVCPYDVEVGSGVSQMQDDIDDMTKQLKEIVDLTESLQAAIRKANMKEGLCSIFVTHTTAAVTTGEIGEGTEHVIAGKRLTKNVMRPP